MDQQLRLADRSGDPSLYFLELLRAGEIRLDISSLEKSKPTDYAFIAYDINKGFDLLQAVLERVCVKEIVSPKFWLFYPRDGEKRKSFDPDYICSLSFATNLVRVSYLGRTTTTELPLVVSYLVSPLLLPDAK